MKKCANCGLENDDDEVCCCECGRTEFKAVSAPAKNETEPRQPEYEFCPLSAADRQKDFMTLVTCRTLLMADFVVSRLRAAGIEAFIPDQSVTQWFGGTFNTDGFVRVQIAPKDYEAAKDLLAG
jgi:hypothetical protein